MSFHHYGQQKFQFERLTVHDGLLDATIFEVYQDFDGFIWIASAAGLQRYDGYDFINFKHDVTDENSFPAGVIRHITQSSDSTIWIGSTGGGLIAIKSDLSFTVYKHNPDNENSLAGNNVEFVLEDTQRKGLWVATNKGLDFFKGSKFKHHTHDINNPSSLSNNAVFSLALDQQNNLWVGTQIGLNRLLDNGNFIQYFHIPGNPNSIAGDFVHDILIDHQNIPWFGMARSGLSSFNAEDSTFISFVNNPDDHKSLPSNNLRVIEEDPQGNLWIGTWGAGLIRYDRKNFRQFQNDPVDPKSIYSDNVEDIMIDQAGNIWTGNYLGSVNKLTRRRIYSYPYQIYRSKGMLPTGNLRDIYVAPDSSIWFSSHNGVMVLKDNEFTQMPISDGRSKGLSRSTVNCVFHDSYGRIWFGSDGGIDLLIEGSYQSYEYDKSDKNSGLQLERITKITEDKQGNIWIGSLLDGLHKYKDGVFTSFKNDPKNPNSLPHNSIFGIEVDQQGNIWFATGKGLSKFNDGQFTNYLQDPNDPYSLPQNILTTATLDNHGDVWVSYNGGVSKLDVETGRFKVFSSNDGLFGNVIEDIDVDSYGNVWAISRIGASRFNTETQKFENFTIKDGFEDGGLVRMNGGRQIGQVIFGGPGGIYTYDPRNDSKVTGTCKLLFTRLDFTDNKYVNESILLGSKHSKETITLDHKHNSFKLKFTVLNNEVNPIHQFYYRVNSTDSLWNYNENDNAISFSYLKPGNYKVEIKKVSDSSREVSTFLNIKILPPWWNTTWFKWLSALLLTGCVLLFYKWRYRFLENVRRELSSQVSEKTEEVNQKNQSLINLNEDLLKKIDQLKATQDQLVEAEKMASIGVLTAGLAHELNNPLSYIGGITYPLKMNLDDLKAQLTKDQVVMTREIFDEINLLLDNLSVGFNKASDIIKRLVDIAPNGSAGLMTNFDVSASLKATLLLFQKSNAHVKFKSDIQEELCVNGSQIELNQVFINLLKNAIDATPDEKKGEISVTARNVDEQIIITVEDNGTGLDPEISKQIFEPFFTTKPVGQGTGLGLYISYSIIKKHSGKLSVFSNVGEGTIFKIALPSNKG